MQDYQKILQEIKNIYIRKVFDWVHIDLHTHITNFFFYYFLHTYHKIALDRSYLIEDRVSASLKEVSKRF